MTKSLKNPFKNSKLKAFFFFLILALFFWILTKFSREYTATVVADLDYINIPPASLLADDNQNELSFDLTENGFEFLLYQIRKPVIRINVGEYSIDNSKEVVISEVELKKLVSIQISDNVLVKNFSTPNLIVKLDTLVSKKLKVIANTQIGFKDGFRSINTVVIKPDSVLVSGPSKYLKEIDSVKTILFSVENIEKSIEAVVLLDKFNMEDVSANPNKVTLSLNVEEFAQKQMKLPIEIINAPSGTTIKLIPNFITVSFSASLTNFKNISIKDFRLVCDFAERNKEENFMIPKLLKHPDSILNIEFDTKKIDYLVFK